VASGSLVRGMLGADVTQRMQTLTETRAAAVDLAAEDRRRIERDLHDGVQQRLVALAMDLGRAKGKLETDPEAAKALVDEAHEEAKRAITEVRDLARGIYPAVLTDLGLDAALSSLAARSTISVDVDARLSRRPPASVEAAAYFVVSEALTNAAKHSRATRVQVTVRAGTGRLAHRPGSGRRGRWRRSDGFGPRRTPRSRPSPRRRTASALPRGRPDRSDGGAAMRVVIAEDAVLLRDGLTRLLVDERHEVVAAVGDAAGLVEAVGRERPDVCIVDVRMPPTFSDEGMRAAIEIRSRWPGTPMLVLSQYVEERYAIDLLSGDTVGVGYLLKDRVADVGEFLESLERVAGGGTALDPEVVAQLLARARRHPHDELTPREREVLALMAEGLSNAGIAQRLVITEGAVEKHVTSIFAKLRLEPAETDHRRVLAVLQYLEGR
jgi:DNA-binding NarL/FixJ family response regulator